MSTDADTTELTSELALWHRQTDRQTDRQHFSLVYWSRLYMLLKVKLLYVYEYVASSIQNTIIGHYHDNH